MNETWTTLQGWIGNDVVVRDTPYGTVASFRIGCTPRYLKNGQWTDGETSWYSVNTWRALADNVATSLHKGDAVVVHGRMRLDEWSRDGTPSIAAVVEATFVGHDLNRGQSTFSKSVRPERTLPSQEETVKEIVHDFEPGGPQLGPDGEPRSDRDRPAA